MKYILEAIEKAQTIDVEGYKFTKYPFGEEGNYLSLELIQDIKEEFLKLYKELQEPDYIVSTEPGSHTWGLLLSSVVGKPLNIIRVKDSKLPTNESLKEQRTGYCVRNLYFDNFQKGDSVIILEDVISTGNTIKTIIETLSPRGINFSGVLCIIRKGLDDLDKYGIPIKPIVEEK